MLGMRLTWTGGCSVLVSKALGRYGWIGLVSMGGLRTNFRAATARLRVEPG